MIALLYAKANSKENVQRSFFREMLMSAFLLRFKANYLGRMRGYPKLSLWIPMALIKIFFFRVVLIWRKELYV